MIESTWSIKLCMENYNMILFGKFEIQLRLFRTGKNRPFWRCGEGVFFLPTLNATVACCSFPNIESNCRLVPSSYNQKTTLATATRTVGVNNIISTLAPSFLQTLAQSSKAGNYLCVLYTTNPLWIL